MKDFAFWRNEIQTAMRVTVLEEIGEGIAETQKQTDAFAENKKLTEAQLAELRKLYGERMKKLKKDIGTKPL